MSQCGLSAIRAGLCLILSLGIISLGPVTRVARADLVPTRAVIEVHQDAPRLRVQGFLERGDVQTQLEALGISPAEARSRVAGLTADEVAAINARLDELPAGGSFAGAVVGIILVLFLALLITDLLGFTDVFPFVDPLPRGQARSR